ncbi:GGDEF domain-containing protein [Hyphomicrobium sp.]|uniref:GGDEF domain-containing protein n=2 Tax=Hyphomicrobium sp. TaxID=82 RepID=UPI0025B9894C|nr:GGDEF domain-containing protein [Hyphomicrobium sp.]
MTKVVGNFLLGLLVGSVLTLTAVVGFNHAPWDWSPSIALSNLREFVSTPSPAVLAYTALALSVTGLLTFYWRDAVALAGRSLRRASSSGPRPVTHSTEQPLRGQAEVNAVRDELERQLGRLIVLIAGQLENSKDHVASLKDTSAHLASVTNVSELREVVQSLISKNEMNERQTRDLEARLKEAQDQTSTLRQRLIQAEKLASLDPLTSVANRRRFEQFIAAAVNNSHADGTPLCLIMTDIDHFKKVNDTYGHAAGDRVLKGFADLLSQSVRKGDLVARFGGEEFAVVLPQTPMGDAFAIAERIRSIFELHGGSDESLVGEFGRLTASFGVAEIREGEPPSALIQRADQMLYEAKYKGRNRTMIWSSSAATLGVECI